MTAILASSSNRSRSLCVVPWTGWRARGASGLLVACGVVLGCGDPQEDAAADACAGSADAPEEWGLFEEEVISLTNDARAAGATCGANGDFPSAPPLSIDVRLQCAARKHSRAMGDDGFFAHDDPNTGTSPFDRIEAEGYAFSAAGENIAAGYASPAEVVQGWLDSDGHCANLMGGAYTHIGVGYAFAEGSDFGHYWTQVFATPLGGG